jgi:hypothetical protein
VKITTVCEVVPRSLMFCARFLEELTASLKVALSVVLIYQAARRHIPEGSVIALEKYLLFANIKPNVTAVWVALPLLIWEVRIQISDRRLAIITCYSSFSSVRPAILHRITPRSVIHIRPSHHYQLSAMYCVN